MKIVTTFVPRLYSIKYDGEEFAELDRLLNDWGDPTFVVDFFEINKSDLVFFNSDVESAIEATYLLSDEWEDSLMAMSENNNLLLDTLFKPLNNNEYQLKPLSSQKAKQRWLRIYAIKIETNLYVITGGAIKLTHTMGERPHTQQELKKLQNCKDFLKKNGVFDADSFYDFKNEAQ
jgi:hypothetical protein